MSLENYTKRARPTVVYAGLVFIGLIHVLLPAVAWTLASAGCAVQPFNLTLPSEFWWAWSGVCGVYAIGRSWEKRKPEVEK